MLLKEIKALKTVAGQDRFGNPIAGKDLYDERRVYIVDGDMKTIESFMSMEAATRAMKNNPKKFPKGDVKIMSGKELNKMFHAEVSESLTEEALETKDAEDLWGEGSPSSYTSTAIYQVRPIKGTEPTKYEAFTVIGDKRKPFGKFNAQELKNTLKPIRANQTPDAEGFTTYTDPAQVEAFKYDGEPIRVKLDDAQTVQMNKGDYLVRTVRGNNFEYNVEAASDFESTLKKA